MQILLHTSEGGGSCGVGSRKLPKYRGLRCIGHEAAHPLPGAKERYWITLSQWTLWMFICRWDKTPYAGQSKFDRGKQPKTAITLGYILIFPQNQNTRTNFFLIAVFAPLSAKFYYYKNVNNNYETLLAWSWHISSYDIMYDKLVQLFFLISVPPSTFHWF